ncbi:hypothetical protein HDE_11463 [Halotydeus destructor]|nr:hypothetical protein HDE_11463 [Halotydeus destructor]
MLKLLCCLTQLLLVSCLQINYDSCDGRSTSKICSTYDQPDCLKTADCSNIFTAEVFGLDYYLNQSSTLIGTQSGDFVQISTVFDPEMAMDIRMRIPIKSSELGVEAIRLICSKGKANVQLERSNMNNSISMESVKKTTTTNNVCTFILPVKAIQVKNGQQTDLIWIDRTSMCTVNLTLFDEVASKSFKLPGGDYSHLTTNCDSKDTLVTSVYCYEHGSMEDVLKAFYVGQDLRLYYHELENEKKRIVTISESNIIAVRSGLAICFDDQTKQAKVFRGDNKVYTLISGATTGDDILHLEKNLDEESSSPSNSTTVKRHVITLLEKTLIKANIHPSSDQLYLMLWEGDNCTAESLGNQNEQSVGKSSDYRKVRFQQPVLEFASTVQASRPKLVYQEPKVDPLIIMGLIIGPLVWAAFVIFVACFKKLDIPQSVSPTTKSGKPMA